MKWFLSLYPSAWQKRYRVEVEAMLRADRAKFRTSLDLLAGAFDAWLNPRWTPQAEQTTEEEKMITASRCGSIDISKADAARSGAWMIGVTLVLTILGVALDKTVGPHVAIEALLLSAFFIALTISSRDTFLKPYSRIATNGMILLSCVGWYVFFLAVTAIGELI